MNRLTVDQDKHLAKWIELRQGACPVCGSRKYEAHSFVSFEIQQQPAKPTDLLAMYQLARGALLPCALIVCEDCGDVRTVSLIACGILDGRLQPIEPLQEIKPLIRQVPSVATETDPPKTEPKSVKENPNG